MPVVDAGATKHAAVVTAVMIVNVVGEGTELTRVLTLHAVAKRSKRSEAPANSTYCPAASP